MPDQMNPKNTTMTEVSYQSITLLHMTINGIVQLSVSYQMDITLNLKFMKV